MNCKVVGEVFFSSHCQEPLSGASRVVHDRTHLSAAASCWKKLKAKRSLKCTKVANKSENKKKRKAPEKRIEGEVCVNGG